MTVELDGIKEFNRELKKMASQSDIEMEKLIVAATTTTHANAIKGIQSLPATGRLYKRGSRTHRASAAGEYPMTDTGNLVRNITIKRINKLEYTVGSRKGAPYGYHLEMKSPSKGGRPWLSRAFNEMKTKLNSMVKAKIK